MISSNAIRKKRREYPKISMTPVTGVLTVQHFVPDRKKGIKINS